MPAMREIERALDEVARENRYGRARGAGGLAEEVGFGLAVVRTGSVRA